MKKEVLGIFVLFFTANWLSAQECVVKDSRLNQKYEGDCKKGLAHGKGKAWGETDRYEGGFRKGQLHGYGIYTWGDGSVYTGEFTKGDMHGEGELVQKSGSGENTVKRGFFKKGEYIGTHKEAYKVITQRDVRNISFRKNAGDINQVRINVYANGNMVSSGIAVNDRNNSVTENRNGIVFTSPRFPLEFVEVEIQLGTFTHQAVFDIYSEGNWEVNISL
jgi:hypothetical protein